MHLFKALSRTFDIFKGVTSDCSVLNVCCKGSCMSKTTSILVIDDNLLNIETITRRLERDGFHTFKAESGAQAFKILDNFIIDLILLDVMMPEMAINCPRRS